MRAWVLENGLLDHTGHHFNNSVGLFDECARRGIEARFLVSRHAEAAVIAALDARPVFDFGPYDSASSDSLAGPLENLIIQGNAFAQGLASAKSEMAADDLILVPSTLQNELYGCALGLAQLPPERKPRLVLTFIIENFFAAGTRTPGLLATLYRFAVRQLARVQPAERTLLAANGAQMAGWLAQILAQPVAAFPIPKVYPSESSRPRHPGPRRVAILGHSRTEKGFHLVPELVALNPGLHFLIQVSPAGAESLWQEAAAAVKSAANVELVAGSLDPAAYHALMARADIVLLPYDPARMPFRSSGVFAEATGAGKVTVVPKGTWMDQHLTGGHGAGVAFDAFDAGSITAALRDAMQRLPELESRARRGAPTWRAAQSVGGYLDRVLERFGDRDPSAHAGA